jgi:peptidoglycan hydrolase-like protein with peptidoglycan-binding domain
VSQSHLTLAFPPKSPANAKTLAETLHPMLPELFKAEDAIGTVHYSRFTVLSDKTFLFNAGNTVPNAGWNMPPAPGTSQHLQTAANLSKDDVRQAQLELRNMGLYNGSLDGVVGPETKRGLEQFQKNNGLDRTATLDGQTMVALFGNIGTSQGSSMPPTTNQGAGSMTSSSGASDVGDHTAPR